MNRTKIEWCDYSWNPVTGCLHGCWYCYAKKLTVRFPKNFPNGFKPTFYPDRLKEPYELKKPAKIFVCSIADLFAPWTPREWMQKVFGAMYVCPLPHTFIMLTKHPERIPKDQMFPGRYWMGTTVTGENHDEVNIDHIKKVNGSTKFVSFEPLLGPIDLKQHSLDGIQWVIIGKLTGSKKVKLDQDWVWNIMFEAGAHGIPVFIKDNVGWAKPPQQFPMTTQHRCQCVCGCKNHVDDPMQPCCNYCNEGWCEGQ